MTRISRRCFLGSMAAGSVAIQHCSSASSPASAPVPEEAYRRGAAYWRPFNGMAQCMLCPHRCLIPDGERGLCGVREYTNSSLFTLSHNRACKAGTGTIEDRGLWHFLPGEKTLTLTTAGCNLACRGCPTWRDSQNTPDLAPIVSAKPEEIVESCRAAGCNLLAFDDSEPGVAFEWLLEVLEAARSAGLKTILCTNGYLNLEPLLELAPHLSAVNVSLKAFSEPVYRSWCGGSLQPVLENLKVLTKSGVWLELAYPMISSVNDNEQMTREAAQWINANLGPDIPLHFLPHESAFRARKIPPTSRRTMTLHWKLAMREGLHYVYLHGFPDHEGRRTLCPGCLVPVASRMLGKIETAVSGGKCPLCAEPIAGSWNAPTVKEVLRQDEVV